MNETWEISIEKIDEIERDLNHVADTEHFILNEMERQRTVMDSIRDRLSIVNDHIGRGASVLKNMRVALMQHKLLLVIIVFILLCILLVILVVRFL